MRRKPTTIAAMFVLIVGLGCDVSTKQAGAGDSSGTASSAGSDTTDSSLSDLGSSVADSRRFDREESQRNVSDTVALDGAGLEAADVSAPDAVVSDLQADTQTGNVVTCIVTPPSDLPCRTPCDCPESAPVCLDARCREGGVSCDSDWDCGCGRLCIGWSCQVPTFANEIWAMESCECPAGFPYLGEDFRCSTSRATVVQPWMCGCLENWNETSGGCEPAPPMSCQTSSDCWWRQRCAGGLCTSGAPACCSTSDECPAGTFCDTMTDRCVKETL